MPDIHARCPRCHADFMDCVCTGAAPDRLAVLATAIAAEPGEWTSHRAHRLYRTAGIAPGRRTARRDLAALARRGLLTRHDDPARRHYTRKDRRS